MVLINNKSDCCGCSLCAVSCPVKAITMKEDREGFLYPDIDNSLCVDCGKCKAVCVFQNPPKSQNAASVAAYAAINKNSDMLYRSSSGGVFGAAAESVLENGGVVAGCIFDDNFNAVHTCTENAEDIKKMQGSKYVQSSIQDVYSEISDLIKSDRKVLFTGTPCQTAAIKRYTNDSLNLYTIDLVCHGVPSGMLFKKHLKYIENKYHGSVVEYSFRGKYAGWGKHNKAVIKTKSGKKCEHIIPSHKLYYTSYFFNNLISRESCYNCVYKCPERQGDMTICDYWGQGNGLSYDKRKLGISAIIVNTENGKKLLSLITDKLELHASSFDKIAKGNENLCKPGKVPEHRSATMDFLISNDGIECARDFYRKNRVKIIKRDIKAAAAKAVPGKLKEILKNMRTREKI